MTHRQKNIWKFNKGDINMKQRANRCKTCLTWRSLLEDLPESAKQRDVEKKRSKLHNANEDATTFIHTPFGRPSCCSSREKSSESTSYLAADDRRKCSAATRAFTSDIATCSMWQKYRRIVSAWPWNGMVDSSDDTLLLRHKIVASLGSQKNTKCKLSDFSQSYEVASGGTSQKAFLQNISCVNSKRTRAFMQKAPACTFRCSK